MNRAACEPGHLLTPRRLATESTIDYVLDRADEDTSTREIVLINSRRVWIGIHGKGYVDSRAQPPCGFDDTERHAPTSAE